MEPYVMIEGLFTVLVLQRKTYCIKCLDENHGLMGWLCVQAVEAIEQLRKSVDSLIVIPNDRLLDVSEEKTLLQDAFSLADDVLRQGVQGISDIITVRVLLRDSPTAFANGIIYVTSNSTHAVFF